MGARLVAARSVAAGEDLSPLLVPIVGHLVPEAGSAIV